MRKGVLLGCTDSPLSAEGHAQARLVSERLRAVAPFRAFYASPLRRALQSVAWMLSPWTPLTVLDDLREISYGEWDGLSWSAIEARNPELARRKAEDWLGVEVPGGEPWPAFAARVGRALEHVRRGPLPALIVAHQGVNSEIAHQLTGAPQTEFYQDYCEIKRYASDFD